MYSNNTTLYAAVYKCVKPYINCSNGKLLRAAGMVLIGFIAIVLLSGTGAFHHASSTSGKDVLVINLDYQIDPGATQMFKQALNGLNYNATEAVVIEMNTPGGLLSDMEDIVGIINATETHVPVYTYIVQDGWGASAGSYIAMATDKIYMGPGSFIGPSTPIVEGGSAVEQQHVTDGMEAYMMALAQAHGRNVTAAAIMVLNNTAYPALNATKIGLVNGMADNFTDFISAMNLSAYPQVTVNENFYDQFLSALSNSFVDGLLLTIGTLAILLDIYHGTVIISVVGLLCIGLGLIGLEIIGAQPLGIFLIIIGAAIMLLEFKTGHGIALVSGMITALVGAFLLSPDYISYAPSAASSAPNSTSDIIAAVIFVIVGLFVAFYLMQISKGFKSRKYAGVDSLIGVEGVAKTEISTKGWISIEGQQWQARSDGGIIEQSAKVVVVSRDGLTLIVKKKE